MTNKNKEIKGLINKYQLQLEEIEKIEGYSLKRTELDDLFINIASDILPYIFDYDISGELNEYINMDRPNFGTEVCEYNSEQLKDLLNVLKGVDYDKIDEDKIKEDLKGVGFSDFFDFMDFVLWDGVYFIDKLDTNEFFDDYVLSGYKVDNDFINDFVDDRIKSLMISEGIEKGYFNQNGAIVYDDFNEEVLINRYAIEVLNWC